MTISHFNFNNVAVVVVVLADHVITVDRHIVYYFVFSSHLTIDSWINNHFQISFHCPSNLKKLSQTSFFLRKMFFSFQPVQMESITTKKVSTAQVRNNSNYLTGLYWLHGNVFLN